MIANFLLTLLIVSQPAAVPTVESSPTITGDETWLVADEPHRRQLIGQRYFELFDLGLKGLESICPEHIADRARTVAAAVAATMAEGDDVMVVIDGSEDIEEFDTSVARLLRRGGGIGRADLPQLLRGLRSVRAHARAECVRQALWSAGVTAMITLGPPRVEQPAGRRGAIVYVLRREPPAESKRPVQPGETRAPAVVPVASQRARPAKLLTSQGSPRHGRLGLELQSGYLVAERTHFWASGGWLAAGVVLSDLPLRRARLRLGLGYFYSDGATAVQVADQTLREFVKHHGAVFRFEVAPVPRFTLGLRVHLGYAREILQPSGTDVVQRGLLAFAAGPGAAFRLFKSPRWEGHLRYDLMLVASPRDVDRGLGRLHLFGISVAALPITLLAKGTPTPLKTTFRSVR